MLENWKRRSRQLKAETYALYLAYRDPRTPWYAKVFVAFVVGYAFSPIDLIPDPIPILGYLDERDQQEPERGLAVVVLPEFVPARWWHELLHNQTARAFKRALLYRRGVTGKNRVIIDVPYHLHR
jgi:hypothetical protein